MKGKTSKLVMLLISFAFILLFQFIPAPAGLNQTSMQVIGIFIGIMLMWNFIGTDWPSLLCMAILAIFQIMSPGDIFKSGFGNSTIAFLLVFFMLSHVLSQVGLTRRLAIWFFTNKLAQRSPWMFVTMFLFGAMFMASFMSQTAALLVFLPIAEQVFKELKYEKGDRFPQMLVLGLGIAVGIGSANTPLGHAIILIPIQLLESQTGLSVNIMAYSAFGIVTGLLIFAALILVYRLLYRPDLNKLRHYDATRLRSDLQPMSVQEKISAVLFVVVIVIWLLQGFLKDIAPTVGGYISALGNAVPVMVAIVILCLTKVDGKPIMDYKDAAARGVPWSALIFNAAVLVISGALTLEKVGISDFLISNVTPLVSGMNQTIFILVIAILVQLLETVMKKFMPPLYKAMPSKGREEYLYDDKALEQYRKTHKGNFTLQRYKGLGEMDAAQLWETTLNPETRILKKVEIEDARIASDITGLLMGPDVPPRKAFIYKHAHDAELDI